MQANIPNKKFIVVLDMQYYQHVVRKLENSQDIDLTKKDVIFTTDDESECNDVYNALKILEEKYLDKFNNAMVLLRNAQTGFVNQIAEVKQNIVGAPNVKVFFDEFIAKEDSKPKSLQQLFLSLTSEHEHALEESEELFESGISFILENNNKPGLVLVLEGLKRYEQVLSQLNAHAKELAQLLSTLYVAISENETPFFKMCKNGNMFACMINDLRNWREYMKKHPFTLDSTHRVHEPTMSAIFQIIQQLDVSHCEQTSDDPIFF